MGQAGAKSSGAAAISFLRGPLENALAARIFEARRKRRRRPSAAGSI
jgi:hypothetical protein